MGLAVAPESADKIRVHELIHDQTVAGREMLADERRAVRDFLSAEVTLQVPLHF